MEKFKVQRAQSLLSQMEMVLSRTNFQGLWKAFGVWKLLKSISCSVITPCLPMVHIQIGVNGWLGIAIFKGRFNNSEIVCNSPLVTKYFKKKGLLFCLLKFCFWFALFCRCCYPCFSQTNNLSNKVIVRVSHFQNSRSLNCDCNIHSG